MFEMMDPYGEAEVWASFVPPVPPDDDTLVDVADLDTVVELSEDGALSDDTEVSEDGELPDDDGLSGVGVVGSVAVEATLALVEFEEWTVPGLVDRGLGGLWR